MQQEHEHHLLLNLNSHNHNHDDSSSSFVGQADNSSSHPHHHHQPITTTPKYTKRQQDRTTQPSLWNTKEFYVYYLVFMFCVPYMFKTAHEASSVDNPNYEKYQHLLSDGFFGYKLDNSDGQWAGFRNNLPKLLIVVSIYIPLSHLFTSFFVPSKTTNSLKSPQQPLVRTYFFLAFSAIYLYFMYGNSILKIMLIVSTNYAIAKLGRNARWMPVATWAFNIAVLFLNEGYKGYNFSDFHEALTWLDDNTGMDRRWDVHFNFTMLRLVSFNLDYYWSFNSDHELIMEDRDRTPSNDKERVSQPAFAGDYCFTYYVAFALYAPLYVAGPIMTFNDFISQLRYPKTIPAKTLLMWVARLIFSLITMEFVNHYMYMVAISKTQAWDNDTILQIAMIALFNLVLIWLKLLIIWRFFRLWALLDGIEAPENMIRCVTNNYSALGFWRSWHKSFNLWIIRYIYVPLGGTRYAMYNIWVVFTFVAVWHDINLKLLAWGWLISLFILPEIVAGRVFSKQKWGSWPYYRHLCAVGAVGNILLMITANLVGFCTGLEGTKMLIAEMFSSTQGYITLLGCLGALFVCAQIQFEVRESEKRRGLFLNC
ncbi:MBOAT-domain-containing protein [Linnemannia elongata AG-77]|uniref:MBOAT-domain-containing protein n=1 Tax=Linnemannia elongata AG-77 TaxID=1314771 RepID=A0A197JY86_9FUNG|nr:MBOAT-domain-containing protein [Linnemannia elongata AG-77]